MSERPRDPMTPEEWQEAVDAAEFSLLVHSCKLYGLVEINFAIDVARAEDLLARGRKRGVVPAPIEELIERAFDFREVAPSTYVHAGGRT